MPCARVVKSTRVLLFFFTDRDLHATLLRNGAGKEEFAADLVLKKVVFLKLLPLLHRHPAILGPTVATFSGAVLLECCLV